ncbi:hypothetical protein SNEBB_001890 [Seison nebaliae]|nr:hypothetical protein SNEBB_001890 [Seison nebaliae]
MESPSSVLPSAPPPYESLDSGENWKASSKYRNVNYSVSNMNKNYYKLVARIPGLCVSLSWRKFLFLPTNGEMMKLYYNDNEVAFLFDLKNGKENEIFKLDALIDDYIQESGSYFSYAKNQITWYLRKRK